MLKRQNVKLKCYGTLKNIQGGKQMPSKKYK